ncbi:sensor domain-containing diguanylate cyclase [Bowmanella denitrificans]|uniref:sensor domain-containing diguanylate cyclase n=1 Tax=Bowmanella denitrificans TaxID=366582 RepID=UPI000C999BE6|nr:sensor domain-containing diguanylate cyclase [Bowmanella denitrificans]
MFNPSLPLQDLLNAMPDATLVVDSEGQILICNHLLEELFGYPPRYLEGEMVSRLIPQEQRSAHHQHIQQYMQTPQRRMMGAVMTLYGQKSQGDTFPVDIMLSPLVLDDKKLVICTVRDMTDIKQMQDALTEGLKRERQLARIDALTGCANRRAFMELAEYELERCSRYQRPFSLAYLDLDNFKQVNDLHGHLAGDNLLQNIARRLQSCLRSSDTVARIGGDEFVLLLPETPQNVAKFMLDRLHHQLLEEMAKQHCPVTFSIGVLSCTQAPEHIDHLLKMVDELMYSIKQKGKNAIRYCHFPAIL